MSVAFVEPSVVSNPPRLLRLRFAFGAAVWRIALGVFLVRELIFFVRVGRFVGLDVLKRIAFVLYKVPESLFVALVSALVVAIFLELVVRVLTQPRVRRWLQPRCGHSFAMPYAFRLEASERVVSEWPARRRLRRGWQAGTLVLTDRRLGFIPHAWDAEPWWIDRRNLAESLATEPAPAMSWGFVSGLPDRLIYRSGGGTETFALLDPETVLDHFGFVRPIDEPLSTRLGRGTPS
jgi:hypothetical protein